MTAASSLRAALLLTLAAATASAAEPTLSIPLGDGENLELVLVKNGKFQQGSPATEKDRGDDESQRDVTITKDYFIGKYPVTRGQFARFVKETRYRTESERGKSGGFGWDGSKLVQRKEYSWHNPGFQQTDAHPVTIVTYADAQAFCEWLTKKAKRTVNLPTEAQWEYACRGGSTTRYPNGDKDEDLDAMAWHKANAGNGTRPVGQKKANEFGLHDMNGNVYQWCRDWYGPYEAGPVDDPEEQRANRTDPSRRVLRGGSWLKDAKHCRSAARYRNTPGSRNADNSFRVIAALELAAAEAPPDEAPPPAEPKMEVPEPFGGPEPFQPSPSNFQAPTPAAGILPLLSGGACVCFLPAAIVVIAGGFILRNYLQTSNRGGPGPGMRRPTGRTIQPMPRDVQIRPAADGFWIAAGGLQRGSIIRYRCRAGGMEQSGEVPYEPGPQGQFVYTGSTPTDIRVVEIVPPDDDPPGTSFGTKTGRPYRSSLGPSSSRRSPPPHHGPSRGYPSAY